MKAMRSTVLAAALGISLAAAGCKKAGPEAESGEAPAAETETETGAEAPAAAAPTEAPAEGAAGEKTPAELAAALDEAAQDDGALVAVGADGKTRVAVPGQTTLADTDTYSIRAELPAASAGQASAVTIHVSPKPGWKLNKDFPTKLSVTAPAGVTVAKASQSAQDAAVFGDQAAAFEIGFTPSSAGAKQFSADFRFAVCTESTCDPKKEKLAFAVDVK